MTDSVGLANPAPGCASLPFRSSGQGSPYADLQVFDYPGGYYVAGEGDAYAQVRMEELHSQHLACSGTAAARGIAPGRLFTLTHHTQSALNNEYLITACEYRFQANDYEADSNTSGVYWQYWLCIWPFRNRLRVANLTKPTPFCIKNSSSSFFCTN